MKGLKFFWRNTCYLVLVLLAALTVLEILYRYQWIDFYKTELESLNTKQELCSKKKKILVFGDSFSAQAGSYVQYMKDSLRDYTVINCAVPGTSAREMSLVAGHRIARFHPQKIVIQVYEGNDLVDIHHPVNWKEVSVLRNLYWWLSDKFYSLAWLNYKAGQWRVQWDAEQHLVQPKEGQAFDAATYNGRVKLLLKADAEYVTASTQLETEEYRKAFSELCAYIEGVTSCFSQNSLPRSVVLLLVPHCTTVSDRYRRSYVQLGAENIRTVGQPSVFAQEMKKRFSKESLVDLLPAFMVAENTGTQVYFANDEHLTAEGQDVAGFVLYQQLSTSP